MDGGEVPVLRGRQGLVEQVVPRDVDGVHRAHAGRIGTHRPPVREPGGEPRGVRGAGDEPCRLGAGRVVVHGRRRVLGQPHPERGPVGPRRGQPREQAVGERGDVVLRHRRREAELVPQSAPPRREMGAVEPAQRLLGERDGAVGVVVEHGHEGLAEPGEVPRGDGPLVAVRVPALGVDRGEARGRVEGVDERAGAVVDGLAGQGHVVRVHHTVHEADEHPAGDELGLRGDHRLVERERGVLGVGGVRVVAGDGLVDDPAQHLRGVRLLGEGRGVLGRADAQVRRGRPGQHRARQHGFAADRVARGDDGERPRGRHAEGVHRLGDHVLAEHGAEHGLPVGVAAREGRATGALEMQVVEPTVRSRELAEEEGAPVAQAGGVVAELVARVRLRDRPCVRAGLLAGEEADAVVGGEPLGVEAELRREAGVEQDELRAVRGLGLPGQGELGEGVGEMRAQGGNGRGHGATLRGGGRVFTGRLPPGPSFRGGKSTPRAWTRAL